MVLGPYARSFENANVTICATELKKTYHLVCNHQHGLQTEPFLTHEEKVLQTGPQQLHHHKICTILLAHPMHSRKAHHLLKTFQNLGLCDKLGMLGRFIFLNKMKFTFLIA